MTQAGHSLNLLTKSLSIIYCNYMMIFDHVARDAVDETKAQLYLPLVVIDGNRVDVKNEARFKRILSLSDEQDVGLSAPEYHFIISNKVFWRLGFFRSVPITPPTFGCCVSSEACEN